MLFSQIAQVVTMIASAIAVAVSFHSMNKRWGSWTEKTRDYWVVLMLFASAQFVSNFSRLKRGDEITAGNIIAFAAIVLMARAATRKGGYEKNE